MCYQTDRLKEEEEFLSSVLKMLESSEYTEVLVSVRSRLFSVQEQRSDWIEMDEADEEELKAGVESACAPVD
jgi:hypothetical protein